jgi:hypothetical protein
VLPYCNRASCNLEQIKLLPFSTADPVSELLRTLDKHRYSIGESVDIDRLIGSFHLGHRPRPYLVVGLCKPRFLTLRIGDLVTRAGVHRFESAVVM